MSADYHHMTHLYVCLSFSIVNMASSLEICLVLSRVAHATVFRLSVVCLVMHCG